MTPRLGQSQTSSSESRPGIQQSEGGQCNSDSKHSLPLGPAALKASHSSSDSPSKSTVPGQAPRPAPRRTDISELPRIPKIRRDSSRGDEGPASRQGVELPSSCISRLTGREGPGQPSCGARVEGEPSNRGAQEPSTHSGGGPQPPGPLGPARGKAVGSTFESFRINIPGNTAHSGRLLSPGFCNTFRPVDSKVQRRASPSPLFSVRKTKQLKSEIYDPFNPTGSDSSSANSSPERLGLLPSEITRTISVDSPKALVLPPVRCVTSYTVQTGAGRELEPPQGPSSLPELQEEEPCAQAQRPSPPEPWGDEELPPNSSFFGSEGRTVTCVTVVEPDTPPSPDAPPATTHRVVELRSLSRSRSRSRSSSRSRKKGPQPRAATREHRAGRSGSRSSRSGDRSSRSASPPAGEDQPKRHRPKARGRRSSSERSSSRERAKRKKAKDKSRERGRDSWGRGRRRSRSRSGSPGSSSHEHREGRRKKRRRSGSRSRGRECSPPRHPRERRGRPRDRRGSRERRRRRSRSPSSEHRPRAHRRPRSREKRSRPRPHSPERKLAPKEASAAPTPQGEPRPDREPPARSPARPPSSAGADGLPEGPEVDKTAPVPEVLAACPAEDVDYGDSVEAGHLFEDFSSDTIFMQLDDMSSPPSPESTDSSPERDLLPKTTMPPAGPQHDTSLAMAIIRREVSRIHGEDVAQPSPGTEGPQEKHLLQQDADEAATVPCALGAQAPGGTPVGKEEGPSQNPLLRAKALVKRVTWNLQEAECGAPANDRGLCE